MAFNFNTSGIASTPVLSALGYGGQQLSDQVAGETEEERRRRLLRLQTQTPGSTLSPVVNSLFGGSSVYGR